MLFHKKKNLMLIGASGGVSNAFLHNLPFHRNYFNKLILVDKSKKVVSDPYIDHDALDYTFVQKELLFPKDEGYYFSLLKKHSIDIVLDLTDMDTLPIFEATNKASVSYLNTAMNDEKLIVADMVTYAFRERNNINNAPHILCTGMNPGVVNMWVAYGIAKYGKPKELIHFEYDTSSFTDKWRSMMTWSLNEFVIETTRDPSGVTKGRDKVQLNYPNALMNRRPMEDILSPIMKLKKYPEGFQVFHEEIISVAEKYDIPSQFIYAFNMQTMDNLVNLYEKNKTILESDLTLGDNTEHPLTGADNIGVILRYPTEDIYYFNSTSNAGVTGTSGTYHQVIIGVYSALYTLLFNKLKKGVYFVEDLLKTHYPEILFDNMRVEEYIFSTKRGKKKLSKYTPQIKIHRRFSPHVYFN